MLWIIIASSGVLIWISGWFVWGMILHYRATHPATRKNWLAVYLERTILKPDFYERYHLHDTLVKSQVGDQIKLHFFGKKTNSKIVVHHHGHQTGHEWGYKLVPWYVKHGYNVVLYDSQGFGDGQKRGFCTFGIREKEALKTIAEYLQETYHPVVLGFHGDSLGGATVLQYASSYDSLNLVQFYVVDSGYQSFRLVLKARFVQKLRVLTIFCWPFFITGFRFSLRIRSGVSLSQAQANRRDLKKIQHPLTWIHSKTDLVVGVQEAYRSQKLAKKDGSDYFSFNYFDSGEHTRLCFSNPTKFFMVLEKSLPSTK